MAKKTELRLKINVNTKGMKGECTKCGEWKPMEEFGFRHMGTGEIRKQAQCNACRPNKK